MAVEASGQCPVFFEMSAFVLDMVLTRWEGLVVSQPRHQLLPTLGLPTWALGVDLCSSC